MYQVCDAQIDLLIGVSFYKFVVFNYLKDNYYAFLSTNIHSLNSQLRDCVKKNIFMRAAACIASSTLLYLRPQSFLLTGNSFGSFF